MTLTRPTLLKLLPIPLAFVAVLVAVRLVAGGGPGVPGAGGAGTGSDGPPLPRSSAQRIAALQSQIRAGADDAGTYAALGGAYLQRVRETGDFGYYTRAEAVYETALRRAPSSSEALTGMGTLALGRHDFALGLRYGLAALRAAPATVDPLYVIVDAQVELGRYSAAARTLQRAMDLKPTLAAYARASYLLELRGDLDGAVRAMRLAISAGGPTTENVVYVQTLLGNLELARGRVDAARGAYRAALRQSPGYVPATAGLARAEAARGELGAAIRLYRSAVARLPLPEYVVGLGETELAAGRRAQARRDLALVGAEQRLLQAGGVNTDVELALYEAEHGSAARGVTLARRAWAAAPSVRSADALGYALARAGRAREGLAWMRRALARGWRDPLVLYHAGMTARAAGRPDLARPWLGRLLAQAPRFAPLFAPRAKRALKGLT
jgi:tetratricopeptide (TPR) repeat protein